MGTTYNIVTVGEVAGVDVQVLQAEVEASLADVNSKMSNWDVASEVSRFNSLQQTTPLEVSQDLIAVMVRANDVYRKTGGRFDVTLGPLIELWGFGVRSLEDPLPSNEDVKNALNSIGQGKYLELDSAARTIAKNSPSVAINLSALAKGYGIDVVANKLTELGFENYMVEVGGDLRTAGKNDKGQVWRVGIEKPEPGLREIKRVVAISDLSMATSGDYRNFVELDGVRFSHIIDPLTGRPITHWTTSVSVIAADAMTADAWATALLVLGNKEGLKVANDNNIAAYFISRNRDDKEQEYVIESSPEFEKLAGIR